MSKSDRSATKGAKTSCSVVRVPKEHFAALNLSNPATIQSMFIDMANSIVNLTEQLVELQGNRWGNQ